MEFQKSSKWPLPPPPLNFRNSNAFKILFYHLYIRLSYQNILTCRYENMGAHWLHLKEMRNYALWGVEMHIPFSFQFKGIHCNLPPLPPTGTIYSVKCTNALEGVIWDSQSAQCAQCAFHILSAFQALSVRSGEFETHRWTQWLCWTAPLSY